MSKSAGTEKTSLGSDARTSPSAVFWLPFSYLWIQLLEYLGKYTWGHGPKTFLNLLGMIVIIIFARPVNHRLNRLFPWTSRIKSSWVGIGLTVAVLVALNQWTSRYIEYINHQNDALIDIGSNTLRAADYFIKGNNPYSETCQTRYQVTGGPNITVHGSEVRMFGIPYSFGYTYFPVMFLVYLPFWVLNADNDAIRWGNLIYSILCFVGVIWLTVRLVPRDDRFAAGALSACIWLYTTKIPQQIYFAGITDIVILMFALYGFVALTYKWSFLAGILFGMAQASKLLPGPFLLIPVLLWRCNRKANLKSIVGYVISSLVFILPFLIWNPPAFISSTILYYLTFHNTGDTTSLWYFLPQTVQTPFLLFGITLSASVLLLALHNRKRKSLSYPLALAFCSYVVFIAFNKMSHLNYLWSIYGLGCAAVVSVMAQPYYHAEQTKRSCTSGIDNSVERIQD